MDRTEASDAFNAGSIPVGCIYITLIIGREMREAACGFLQFKEYFRIRKGLYMWKEKIHSIGNYIIKHNKVVLPAVVVVAVAITVSVSLSLSNRHKEAQQEAEIASAASETATETATEEVPLVANEEGAIYTLIATYYNAMATGDEETLRSVCDEISDKDMYRYVELSQYIDYYLLWKYIPRQDEEGSVIAYVYYKISFVGHEEEVPGYQALYICTNDQGGLYIKRGENSEEVNEYIKTVSTQDDVVEFNNKITVEYNELMVDHPEVLQYISELDSQVSIAVGEKLANQVAAETQVAEAGTEEGSTDGQDTQTENGEQQEAEDQGPQYVTTTTTVNVRSSDSEQADKLGKVSGGTKLQVLEQRPNGWTKVDYEGKEGYIKTEFLQLAESAAETETIGTVTATTNINVRASASETADRLGVLSGGDSAELVGTEGDWSKIKYNGQIGYVKSEYVQ